MVNTAYYLKTEFSPGNTGRTNNPETAQKSDMGVGGSYALFSIPVLQRYGVIFTASASLNEC